MMYEWLNGEKPNNLFAYWEDTISMKLGSQ